MRLAARQASATMALLFLAGCGSSPDSAPKATAAAAPPSEVHMGSAKSVTTFFVASVGIGNGGNFGGLAGADMHCQALATAQGAGDHTWRAYLSASATAGSPAVNARDRIGSGPWHNADAMLIAHDLSDLHGSRSNLSVDTAETEEANPAVSSQGPDRGGIVTGSQADGTAFPPGKDLTCSNWTSNGAGAAETGAPSGSWNSGGETRSCSQADFESTGSGGQFYCFAID